MSTISRYIVCEDPDEWGNESMYESREYKEAEEEALRRGACIIELEYEYSDSSLVADFREAAEQ
jgi:hypothetical protein